MVESRDPSRQCHRSHWLRGVLVLGLAGALFLAGCACPRSGGVQVVDEPVLTAELIRLNLESFDYIWETIRDRHWDPELGGLDWEAVRTELRPRVAEATTMFEARLAMDDMIQRLDQTHFAIFPAEVYDDLGAEDETADTTEGEADTTNDKTDGTPGLEVRVVDGEALVVALDPGSAAAELGVEPGWRIVRVKEQEIAPRLEGLATSLAGKTYLGLTQARLVSQLLKGGLGDSVSVGFLDGDDREVDLLIPLQPLRGKKADFGNLPSQHVWVDTRRLEGDIGYLAFNYFFDPIQIMGACNRAMAEFMDCRGVIVDLRGNGGGIGAIAMGIAGWFIAEKGHRLGTMTTRDSELHFSVNSRPQTFSGPLAVLVDDLSASTSEIFAGGLQDLQRARIFGTVTAGAALPSMVEKLPNGDGFQFAVANYVSEGGRTLEGAGIVPDEVVIPTRQALGDLGDPILTAAVTWIETGQPLNE
ncbi:MAG: S41 family peptidase [bacterium]